MGDKRKRPTVFYWPFSLLLSIPDEKWFAKKYKPFFIGITNNQWFAKTKIRKPLAIEYK